MRVPYISSLYLTDVTDLYRNKRVKFFFTTYARYTSPCVHVCIYLEIYVCVHTYIHLAKIQSQINRLAFAIKFIFDLPHESTSRQNIGLIKKKKNV